MTKTLLAFSLLLALRATAWAQAEAPDSARPAASPGASRPAQPAATPARSKRTPAKKAAPKPAAAPAVGEGPAELPVDPYDTPPPVDTAQVVVPPRLSLTDLAAMQGLLAVQRLDGWLLRDREGDNPVALALVAPLFRPQRAWAYLLPVTGEPLVLCHQDEVAAFEKVRGKPVTYKTAREWDKALRGLLRGRKSLAMELVEVQGKRQPPAELRAALKAQRVVAHGSEHLRQYTTAIWGQYGYLSHYIAAHHVSELRKDALAFVSARLRAKAAVTDFEVAQRIEAQMAMRKVVGPPPSVASGARTATPDYQPSAESAAPIVEGELLVLSIAARLDRAEAVFAAQSHVAFVGAAVPEPAARAFLAVTRARDQAIAYLGQKLRNRQPVRGSEVDELVRRALASAAPARVLHATGHAIDTALFGAGANLDAGGAKDARVLVAGTGVTIGPGLYVPGELGVRSEVTVFLSPTGPQVTTAPQAAIEALLAP